MSKIFGCIYMICNQKNDKKYIGQTTLFKKRIREHRRGEDFDSCPIDSAINKYGWQSFIVRILEAKIPKKKLNAREKFWIDFYQTYKGEGYNATPGGGALSGRDHPNYGTKRPPEQKQKIRKGMLGKNTGPRSAATKRKLSKAHSGKTLSKEHRNKISKSVSGDNNPNVKMNKEKGLEIYTEYYTTNKSLRDLEKENPFCSRTISLIKQAKHWTTRHLEEGELP